MRTVFALVLLGGMMCGIEANAQFYAAEEDAAYLAIIKAVSDYKINDEETIYDMNKLRQDEKFNEEVYRIVQKLENSESKDSKNKRVLKILKQAGKDIYNTMK